MRALLLALLVLVGCGRAREEAKADPANEKTSTVGPSPTSGPAPDEQQKPRCVKGENTEVRLAGRATEAVESITKAEIDDAFCTQLTVARTCIGKLVKPAHDFEATYDVKLTVGPDGAFKLVPDGGTLQDEGMRSCIRDALLAVKLPQGPGEGRYTLRLRVHPP